MSNTFVMMNVLIKGTAAAIQSALATLDSKTYELKKFTYNPKKVDPTDSTIVKVGLIFKEIYKGAISKDEIPFASLQDIKFIGMGNGSDEENSRSDGTYVFYKDFGETRVSECYQFTRVSPFKEEFDGQGDVLDKVHHSFMDHTWQYRFLNYSCGEYDPYAFNGKKDKALIKKWKSDETDAIKKEAQNITIGGMDDIAFSYEAIDGVSPAFYEGIYDGKDFVVSPDETVNVSVKGTDFVVAIKTEKKIKTLLKKFKKAVAGKDVGRILYDPFDVAKGKYEENGEDGYGQQIYRVLDEAETLENVQIAHRASVFAKVNELLKDENAAVSIVNAAPKKKDGTFTRRRVTQIASLFCMEEDTSMYMLCAVAKSDTELVVEIRQIATIDLKKTKADVISATNLFKESAGDNGHTSKQNAKAKAQSKPAKKGKPSKAKATDTIIKNKRFVLCNNKSHQEAVDEIKDYIIANGGIIIDKASAIKDIDYAITFPVRSDDAKLEKCIELQKKGQNISFIEWSTFWYLVFPEKGENTKRFRRNAVKDFYASSGEWGEKSQEIISWSLEDTYRTFWDLAEPKYMEMHGAEPISRFLDLVKEKEEPLVAQGICSPYYFIRVLKEYRQMIAAPSFNRYEITRGVLDEYINSRFTEKQLSLAEKDAELINNGGRECYPNEYPYNTTIMLGNYPQGPKGELQPIEWVIQHTRFDEMLLLSSKALECKPYHSTRESITWEKSSIREWLNTDFFDLAFSEEEKTRIIQTDLLNESPAWTRSGGENTKDHVFLLSEDEVRFIQQVKKGQLNASETKFASSITKSRKKYCRWWLRDVDSDQTNARLFFDDGGFSPFNIEPVDSTSVLIRPAIWIRIAK